MEYEHFQDIKPNDRANFAVLYFSACRTMQKLERAIRRCNNGRLTFVQFMCLKKIHRKLSQMVALWKGSSHKN